MLVGAGVISPDLDENIKNNIIWFLSHLNIYSLNSDFICDGNSITAQTQEKNCAYDAFFNIHGDWMLVHINQSLAPAGFNFDRIIGIVCCFVFLDLLQVGENRR